jgi:LacI family transcriptional regulator
VATGSGNVLAMNVPRITIVDVAEAAAVSVKTVSRVINGEPHVRPQLASKVQAAIDRLGFVPNAAARSLAGARSFVLAALFHNPSPFYLASLQTGAMEACRAAGYHLVIEELSLSQPEAIADFERTLRTARFDGVILSPPVTDCEAILERLEARRIPYVRLSPQTAPARSPAIYSDDQEGARQIARHLWGLGHQRIAFVAGPPDHLASALRRDGFMAALAELGARPDQVEEVRGDFSFASGMAAGIQLLGQSRVSAIFTANDDMAAGVTAAAVRMGRRVPDDVSIVGFDDSPIATFVWPPLTTVRQPIAKMAAAAAQMLIGRRDGKNLREQTFHVELIERQSTTLSPDLPAHGDSHARSSILRK